jgi:hypothetical protein
LNKLFDIVPVLFYNLPVGIGEVTMAAQTASQLQTTASTVGEFAPTQLKEQITGEELWAMDNFGRAELVKGEIVYISPTGYVHGFIEFRIGKIHCRSGFPW